MTTNPALDDISFYKFTQMNNMLMVDTPEKMKELYLSFLKNKYGIDVFDLDIKLEGEEIKVVPNNVVTTLAIADLLNKYKKCIPSKHYKDKNFKNKYIDVKGNDIKIKR